MKLNYDSWFCQKYLAISYNSRPDTICQLIRLFIGVTALYLMLAVIVGGVGVGYVGGLLGLIWILVSDATWASMYVKGAFFREWGLPIFVLMNFTIIFFGSIHLWKKWRENVRHRKYQERFGNGNYVPKEPSVAVQMVKGAWTRIKDKTCVLIEYENAPSKKTYSDYY